MVKKEKVDLNKVFTEIRSNIDHDQNYPNARIFIDELPTIFSDHTMIKQVFQNLIENGLKYNNRSMKIIFIQFTIINDVLNFKIKDNGIGMEEEYLEQIFDMFKRLHNQEEYQGTGIGLAICKKTVQQLGGEIWATSKVGEGSTFHISFPITILWENEKIEDQEVIVIEE